jgi:outer membrane protein OmpA-like peptidoglycan-associated protein
MLLMEELLKDNQKITMTIKGYTSPLNTPEYNLNLAKRRISSLDNYVRKYKNGIFIPYIKSKQLRIETVPFGETQVSNNISDDPNDRRNSVYNPLAAKERKIKVIAVKFVDN